MRPTDQESTAIEKMVVIHSFHEEGRCHAPRTITPGCARVDQEAGGARRKRGCESLLWFLEGGDGQGKVSRVRIG